MKPRRILIFSSVYYPRFVGGAEVAIKEITDRIPAEEMEFDMVTLHLDSSLPAFEKIGNVNIYRVGWAARQKTSSDSLAWYLHLNKYAFLVTGFLKAVSLAKKQVRQGQPYDAVWSMMATYNSFAALFFKMLHPKIPFLLTLQEGDPIEYMERRARPLWPLFKGIFTHADHIQTISTFLADWAHNMGATCPVTVVPNAVDYDLFSHTIPESDAAALKTQLGKKEGDIFLVTTSRLVVKNAVGDVIESLRYLPVHVKFLILGQGYQEAELKAKAAQLEEKAGQKDAESRIHFLGYIPHAHMPPYLQISDIFIRPALSEGLGNSFLEAMAAGIPVIATPVGGIPDFLVDGETGLFCEVSNPKSIAQKVEKLIKDRESREYIVRRAREMVKEKYQWKRIAEKMKNILRDIVISRSEV